MDLRDIQDAIRAGHMMAGSHAVAEAAADGLTLRELWLGLLDAAAEVVEEYPNDPRGPSYLVYCEVQGVAAHSVIAFPSMRAAQQRGYPTMAFLITCYRPGGTQYAQKWTPDFKKRVSP